MIEKELKKIIINTYGSVKQFANRIDIPYTTLDTILKRGVDNSNVVNVIKMCKGLNISVDKLVDEHKIIYQPAINEYDSQIEQLAANNGIKILIDRNAPLTAENVLEVQKILSEVLEKQNKNDT